MSAEPKQTAVPPDDALAEGPAPVGRAVGEGLGRSVGEASGPLDGLAGGSVDAEADADTSADADVVAAGVPLASPPGLALGPLQAPASRSRVTASAAASPRACRPGRRRIGDCLGQRARITAAA